MAPEIPAVHRKARITPRSTQGEQRTDSVIHQYREREREVEVKKEICIQGCVRKMFHIANSRPLVLKPSILSMVGFIDCCSDGSVSG